MSACTQSGKPDHNHPLSCKEICAFLCDYIDNALPSESKRLFDAHMAICSHCREYLETYAQTIRLSKRTCCTKLNPPPPLPDDMVQAILRAVRGAGGSQQKSP